MQIFELTKSFPKEETYSLTDQIRRSSRSVAACIAEAYRKRNYPSYFASKSSDADMENSGTRVWLQLALASRLDKATFETLDEKAREVGSP